MSHKKQEQAAVKSRKANDAHNSALRRGVQCQSHTATGTRCSRWTSKGNQCAQHLRAENGLAIAPSTIAEAGLGLFTTIARRKGERIVPYLGTPINLVSADERYGGEYVLQLTRTQFIDAAATSSGAGRYSNTARPHNVARKQCRGNNAHFTLNRTTKTAWITDDKDGVDNSNAQHPCRRRSVHRIRLHVSHSSSAFESDTLTSHPPQKQHLSSENCLSRPL